MPSAPATAAVDTPAVAGDRAPAALTEDEIFNRKSLAELNAESPLGDVFFPVDESIIPEEGREVLAVNAQWLRRWGATRVTVEGHGDSRGTSEYNLALGERRARAVVDYLTTLGIEPARLLPSSKGEEAPFCVDEAESCWRLNRRGHFVITAK